ncbi:peptidase C39 family protein [Streptomyces sp. NBC_00690]|uniref:peptidase C39 family protein n=1 Tax=Streptomyces sp. NBC_00690 TaxID=2975808 RepID=UPI002E2892D0|nr:peptidase C39 family protein [Streptomyces sp. NBC_00690]
MARATSRRTVLSAAVAVAAGAGTLSAATPALPQPSGAGALDRGRDHQVDLRLWTSFLDWHRGTAAGVRTVPGRRPAVAIARPVGTVDHTDPHTGRTETWEYATWESPVHRCRVPATELIPSWNADTPPGTWLQVELRAAYSDSTESPWLVMGRWAAGDEDVRRASVDGQRDGRASVWTDTLAIDDPASGLWIEGYRLRLTLYRRPGTRATPTVRRLGAMASAVPDRFTVPAAPPRHARELAVPRYSQNTHRGRYPQYDNGGEAWCSPTSSQMVIEFWGRRPTAQQLAWVQPDLDDPQVCHAARFTFDHQYEGCGNWAFNAAYAATYREMNAVVTRLSSLTDLERLIRVGIPVITSQSFLAGELTGAGYGTAGHLMAVIGFTPDGEVIAHDPAAPDNEAVRRVYRRREFEDVWLRTKRYDAKGKVTSGTGGVCYLYWPDRINGAQRRVLTSLGVR